MFRAEQRTDGDRQRRRSPAPCRDHPADSSRRRPRTAKTGGNRQIRDRKRAKCIKTCKNYNIPLHIRTICKGKHPGGGLFSCKIRRKWTAPAPADHHRHHLNTPRTATRGRFTNRKSKAFSPCYATLLLAYTFPFPAPYPCRIPVFGLVPTQTVGRGGGFETGSKKRNGQKAETEK